MSTFSLARAIAAYVRDEGGASASEYALLLAILAGCSVILMRHLGTSIGGAFTRTANALLGP